MSRDKELGRRRPTFWGGRGIRLANGEVWNLPGPEAAFRSNEGRTSYPALARAICEADGESDRGLAELALAIFLLNLNYDLSSADLQELLAFEPGSDALRGWREALREMAASHVKFLREVSSADPTSTASDARKIKHPRVGSRLLSWLRAPTLSRR